MNLFDSAVRAIKTPSTPIWFMRQAGRYLPEYREVRKKYSFDEMLKNADIATEVTLQPIRRFNLDAAVIFADIMTILAAVDIPFHFMAGGPTLEFDISSSHDVEKLSAERLQQNQKSLTPFLTAIRQTRRALGSEKSVVGFAASPFTLLSYLIEGKTSKTHNRTRAFMASYPETFKKIMHSVAKLTVEYLKLQHSAGVSAVQIFESWGDVLGGYEYTEYVLPHIETIVNAISTTLPVIFYDKGASIHFKHVKPFLEKNTAIYSIDWRIGIHEMANFKVQGNLDPALLESTPEAVKIATKEIISSRNSIPGHIFNLGHGITPEAKMECVEAMVETVKTTKI